MSGQKPHPEALYYTIASKTLKSALRTKSEWKKAQLTCTSIVFSAFTLEAFINEEYSRHKKTRAYLNQLQNTEHKWKHLPGRLGFPKGFDHDVEPFKTFLRLLEIRNNVMAHYSPQPTINWKRRNSKGPPAPTDFLFVVKNTSLVRELLSVVKKMIVELHALISGMTDLPKFLEGAEYLMSVWSDLRI